MTLGHRETRLGRDGPRFDAFPKEMAASFAASAAVGGRARQADAPTARRRSAVKSSPAGTPPSRRGRKTHTAL